MNTFQRGGVPRLWPSKSSCRGNVGRAWKAILHGNSLQVLQSHISTNTTNKEPIQLIREKLAELLRALNLPSETIDQVSQAYFSSPQVSLLSILLSALSESTSPPSRDETNKKASVPSSNQEVGLETKLSLIEGKYEKILQQVTKLVD